MAAASDLRARVAEMALSGLATVTGGYVVVTSVTRFGLLVDGQPGAGLLPFIAGLIMVSSAVRILTQPRSGLLTAGEQRLPARPEAARAGGVLAVATGAVALFPLFGAVLSLGLFVLVEMLLIERRSLLLSVATALVIPAALFVVFELLLKVPLPTGWLGLL